MWSGQAWGTCSYTIRSSTSSRGKWLFPSPKRQDRLSWQASYSVGTGGVTPCIKWPERKAGHPPPSSSEVQIGWSCTSTPRIFFHGTAEGHFTSAEVQSYFILQQSLNAAIRLRKHYHMISYKIGLICLHTLYWDWRCILERVCSQTQLHISALIGHRQVFFKRTWGPTISSLEENLTMANKCRNM